MFNAFLTQLPTKRARDYKAALDLKYIITVSNINWCKERDRHKRLENKFSDFFVTKEEDDIEDAYMRENGMKLI